MDVMRGRQQLPAAQTAIALSAIVVQVAVAMSGVLIMWLPTHGPLPKFAQMIVMTRQAVITLASETVHCNMHLCARQIKRGSQIQPE